MSKNIIVNKRKNQNIMIKSPKKGWGLKINLQFFKKNKKKFYGEAQNSSITNTFLNIVTLGS